MVLPQRRRFGIQQNKIIDFEYLAVNEAAERMFNAGPGITDWKTFTQKFLLTVLRKYFGTYANVVETGISVQLEFYQENLVISGMKPSLLKC